jgi:hypothetical protein
LDVGEVEEKGMNEKANEEFHDLHSSLSVVERQNTKTDLRKRISENVH